MKKESQGVRCGDCGGSLNLIVQSNNMIAEEFFQAFSDFERVMCGSTILAPAITSKNWWPKSSTNWGNIGYFNHGSTFTDPLKKCGLIISLFPQRPAQTVTLLTIVSIVNITRSISTRCVFTTPFIAKPASWLIRRLDRKRLSLHFSISHSENLTLRVKFPGFSSCRTRFVWVPVKVLLYNTMKRRGGNPQTCTSTWHSPGLFTKSSSTFWIFSSERPDLGWPGHTEFRFKLLPLPLYFFYIPINRHICGRLPVREFVLK